MRNAIIADLFQAIGHLLFLLVLVISFVDLLILAVMVTTHTNLFQLGVTVGFANVAILVCACALLLIGEYLRKP